LPNGALVWISGCMKGSADTWTITDASEPLRTRTVDTRNYDEFHTAETQPTGKQTYRLANLGFLGNSFKPQDHNGEKLLVKGNLVRQTDAMRISVLAVRGDTCK